MHDFEKTIWTKSCPVEPLSAASKTKSASALVHLLYKFKLTTVSVLKNTAVFKFIRELGVFEFPRELGVLSEWRDYSSL